jgi:hypothetical protein
MSSNTPELRNMSKEWLIESLQLAQKRLSDLEQFPDRMLCDELFHVIDAGNKLAEAAHRVQADHDGIHRLRLALSNWYRVRSDEFGRTWREPEGK